MDLRGQRGLGRRLIVGFITASFAAPFAQTALAQRQVSRVAAKQVTRASWYGNSFKGLRTASGSIFNPQSLTAAHRTLGLGSQVKVTELRSGRSVVVRITDRGPYLPGRGIDLSYAAARQLGIVRQGVAQVRVELVQPEPQPAAEPVTTASCWPATSWLPKAIAE